MVRISRAPFLVLNALWLGSRLQLNVNVAVQPGNHNKAKTEGWRRGRYRPHLRGPLMGGWRNHLPAASG